MQRLLTHSQLPWSELPDTVMDTYKIAVENLLGLHSLTIVANKAVLSVKAESVDIVKLLPTHEQLQSAIKLAAGEEEGSEASGGDDDDKEEEEEKEAVEADKVCTSGGPDSSGVLFLCFMFCFVWGGKEIYLTCSRT